MLCVQHRTLSSSKKPRNTSSRKAAAMRKPVGNSLPHQSAEKTISPTSVTSATFSPDSDSDSKKFALPDKDKERELTRLQDEVVSHYKAGDYRKALKTSQELLEDSQSHFGRDHSATASAFNNSALMHKLLGNFDESRKDYRAALTIYKKVVGDDHASYASALHNLANLNKSQIHFDESLKATDRLSLIEQAAEYLERAWRIRRDEMGEDHPHTVASRSSWGSTLAAQILYHHKASSSTTTKSGVVSQQYVSLLSASVTQHGWVAAEEHLRQALQTAVANPRGPSIAVDSKKGQRKGKKKSNISPPKQKDDALSSTDSSSAHNTTISTLSACSAAQNLAVFLKARATTESPYNQEWLQEAHKLYLNVLETRQQLLPKGHPDLYATTYSLAELLQAMGDEEAANVIRQEIVDTYDPPPPKTQGDDGDDSTHHSDNAEEVVRQTKAKKSKARLLDD
jgi:hypothetical protein